MFSVAIQLYGMRKDMAEDFEGTLKAIAECGYDGVEFAGLHDKTYAEAAAICKKYGLTPISGHVQVRFIEADPAIPAGYAEMGTPYLAIPGHQWESEDFETSIERIRAAAEATKAVGIKMHYHNHDNEIYHKINGNFQLDEIFSRIPADLLGTEFDVGWLTVAGEDPTEWLRRYAGRVPLLHLKDFFFDAAAREKDVRPKDLADAAVGKGVVDVPAVLAAAKDAGTEWLVVEFDNPEVGMTGVECAKASRDYLKTLGV